MPVSSSLQKGIKAYQNGEIPEAREQLLRAVREQPQSEQAWAWLSNIAETREDRRRCLREVVNINPGNKTAAEELERLEGKDWAMAARANILQTARRPFPGIVMALLRLLNGLTRKRAAW